MSVVLYFDTCALFYFVLSKTPFWYFHWIPCAVDSVMCCMCCLPIMKWASRITQEQFDTDTQHFTVIQMDLIYTGYDVNSYLAVWLQTETEQYFIFRDQNAQERSLRDWLNTVAFTSFTFVRLMRCRWHFKCVTCILVSAAILKLNAQRFAWPTNWWWASCSYHCHS